MVSVATWLTLGLSMTALAWAVLSWWQSGARVKVECETHRVEDVVFTDFRVVNRGRLAATVSEVGWHVLVRRGGWPAEWVLERSMPIYTAEKLPLRLEGQAEFRTKTTFPKYWDNRLAGEYHILPWVRVGGRSMHGRPIKRYKRLPR